jgi:hypothetical protein
MTSEETLKYMEDTQKNLRYILDRVTEDMRSQKNPYIPRYVSALVHILLFNWEINTQCKNEFRYSIDVEGNIFRCNICSTKPENRVAHISDQNVTRDVGVYDVPSILRASACVARQKPTEDIAKSNRNLCGFKCIITPPLYTILYTEIERFIVTNNITCLHDMWQVFSFNEDLYPADYSLGSITDSGAFDKIV